MADASLKIRVESNDVKNATGELAKLEKQGGRTEQAMGKLAAKAAGLISVGAAISKIVGTQRQFDVLNAGLVTATKSVDGAAEAFAELEKFAATTPYTLDQSVQGFTKLVNLGLTPSQRALESYGNTASAMGKDLNQMIEAVADAATGEFERLKEFGIKASSQGDQVAFTFQGVTTTVKKNAAEIEQYLMQIGNTQFAGAMASRMATLDGALSNLQDSWDSLFRAVSSQGTGSLIESSVRTATDAIDELKAALESGQIDGYADALSVAWSGAFSDLAAGLSNVDQYMQEVLAAWKDDGTSTANWMSDAFWQFPQNISAAIKIAATELSAFVDKTKIYADLISSYLSPSNWFGGGDLAEYFDEQLEKVDQRVSREYASIHNTYRREIDATNNAIKSATDRRLEYELAAQQKSQSNLEKFKVSGDETQSTGGTKSGDKYEKLKSQAESYLESLRRSLMDESELLRKEYDDRLAQLDEYLAQQAILPEQYREAELLAREEYRQKLAELNKKQADNAIAEAERAAETQKRLDQQLLSAKMQFGSEMLGVIEQSAEDGSTIQKAAFLAQKGMAAAQVIMQSEVNAAAAMAPPPLGLGPVGGATMAASIKSMGYASAAVIAAQGFAGLFDNGGIIPSGQWGIVGEYGPEIVKGPVSVTSRKETAAMARSAANGDAGSGNTYITIQQTITGNGDEALAKVVEQATTSAVNEVQRDFATNGKIRRTAGI